MYDLFNRTGSMPITQNTLCEQLTSALRLITLYICLYCVYIKACIYNVFVCVICCVAVSTVATMATSLHPLPKKEYPQLELCAQTKASASALEGRPRENLQVQVLNFKGVVIRANL